MKPFTIFLLLISSIQLSSAESTLRTPIGLALAIGGFNEKIELTIEENGRYISTYDEFFCMPAEDGTIGRGGTEIGHWKFSEGILRLFPESEFRSWISGRDYSVIANLASSDVREIPVKDKTYEQYFGRFVLLDKSSGILLVFDQEAIDRTQARNFSAAPKVPNAGPN